LVYVSAFSPDDGRIGARAEGRLVEAVHGVEILAQPLRPSQTSS